MSLSSLNKLPTSNDPRQILAHCPAVVAGLPVSVLPIPASGEVFDDHHETTRIFVAQQGKGVRWYQHGSRTDTLNTAPRMIEIYEQGLTFHRARWEGTAGRCVLVEFGDRDVQAMTHGQMRTLKLQTRHEVFDERVSRLTLEIAEETLRGLPNGKLYVQGLCVALLGTLENRYGSGRQAHAQTATRTLGTVQQRRLSDLIHQQLGSKLSLDRMAQEVGLSPQHFSRLFKATYGTTPTNTCKRSELTLRWRH
ncbi:AraC family transcriptional regulator [Polaromonas sp. P2-4]|nr:AraC family transcriptional regulator [Polaromonas sp. P2-4]